MTQAKKKTSASATTTKTRHRQAPNRSARAPRKTKAALSGLRKAGYMIDRSKDDAGQSIYRITGPEEAGQ